MKNAIKDVLLFLKTSKSISLTFMAQNQHTNRKTKYFSKKLPGREKLGIIVSKELKTLLFKQRFQWTPPFPAERQMVIPWHLLMYAD